MHTNILKLVYIHNELLHVSVNHVAIFKDVKSKSLYTLKYEIKL
jgi:hypothetical protein